MTEKRCYQPILCLRTWVRGWMNEDKVRLDGNATSMAILNHEDFAKWWNSCRAHIYLFSRHAGKQTSFRSTCLFPNVQWRHQCPSAVASWKHLHRVYFSASFTTFLSEEKAERHQCNGDKTDRHPLILSTISSNVNRLAIGVSNCKQPWMG